MSSTFASKCVSFINISMKKVHEFIIGNTVVWSLIGPAPRAAACYIKREESVVFLQKKFTVQSARPHLQGPARRCKQPWSARHDTITRSGARSRLDQRRFSRPNTHFAAFFKLYKKIIFSQTNLQIFAEFHGILQIFEKFSENFRKHAKFSI